MAEYIDIGDLPPLRVHRWIQHLPEWKLIPPGKALEVPLLEGDKPSTVRSSVVSVLTGHLPHLRVMQRDNRVFIINEAKP